MRAWLGQPRPSGSTIRHWRSCSFAMPSGGDERPPQVFPWCDDRPSATERRASRRHQGACLISEAVLGAPPFRFDHAAVAAFEHGLAEPRRAVGRGRTVSSYTSSGWTKPMTRDEAVRILRSPEGKEETRRVYILRRAVDFAEIALRAAEISKPEAEGLVDAVAALAEE